MKTILMVIAYSMIATAVFAQVDTSEKKLLPPDYATDSVNNSDKSAVPDKTKVVTEPQDTKPVQSPAKNQPMQNGYMLKNGKVFMIKNGQASSTVETVSLANGSRLMSDGTIIKVDGSRTKMNEGDFVDFSGSMISPRPAEPTDVQKAPAKPKETNPPVDKSKEPQKSNDKNMYLVPDTSIQDYQKQNPKK